LESAIEAEKRGRTTLLEQRAEARLEAENGNAASLAEVDEISALIRKSDDQLDGLTDALAIARRRHTEATTAAQREALAKRTDEMRAVITRLGAACKTFDKRLAAVATSYVEVNALRDELRSFADIHGRSDGSVLPEWSWRNAIAALGVGRGSLAYVLGLSSLTPASLYDSVNGTWSAYLVDRR
jgi:hypothetical protein